MPLFKVLSKDAINSFLLDFESQQEWEQKCNVKAIS